MQCPLWPAFDADVARRTRLTALARRPGRHDLPELDALTMAHNAIESGAAGVDMGRNIFQSDHPVAMIRAIRAVVHESAKPEHAFEEFVRPALQGT